MKEGILIAAGGTALALLAYKVFGSGAAATAIAAATPAPASSTAANGDYVSTTPAPGNPPIMPTAPTYTGTAATNPVGAAISSYANGKMPDGSPIPPVATLVQRAVTLSNAGHGNAEGLMYAALAKANSTITPAQIAQLTAAGYDMS